MDLLFEGHFDTLGLNGYNYRNIVVKEGRFTDDRFNGVIDVEDDNLALNYDGYIDFKNELEFNFDVKIDSSHLVKMKLMDGNLLTNLKTKIKVNLSGNSLDNIKGDIDISKLSYFDGKEELNISDVTLKVSRSEIRDTVILRSPYMDCNLTGKFDFSYMYPVIKNQLALLIPNLIEPETIPEDIVQNYNLKVTLEDINQVINFFDPNLYIEPRTQIELSSDSNKKYSEMQLSSQQIKYENRIIKGITLKHKLDSTVGVIDYDIVDIQLNDSIRIDSLKFNSEVKNNHLYTTLDWDSKEGTHPASFEFETNITNDHDVVTSFLPSFFYLQNSKWEIDKFSELLWNTDYIEVTDFFIRNKEHSASLNGKVSENPDDWLNIDIHDF